MLEVCCRRCEVVAVVTQPDRARGRGRKVTPCAAKVAAMERGIEVLQPERCSDPELLGAVRRLEPDLGVVVAYGQILPGELLEVPRLGFVNVHFSLLPQLRGAAPVARTLQWGLGHCGVVIQKVVEQLDAGDILAWAPVAVRAGDTEQTLKQRLVRRGAELLSAVLERLEAALERAVSQPWELVTAAPSIQKWEGRIDWTAGAWQIQRQVVGLAARAGAYCAGGGRRIKIWAAEECWQMSGEPGTVAGRVDGLPAVACGAHAIIVDTGQVEGRPKVSGRDLANSGVMAVGVKLE